MRKTSKEDVAPAEAKPTIVDELEIPPNYSDKGFWDKVKGQAKQAGKEVIQTALKLYYALQDTDTPNSAKLIIVGALAYFVVPTDAVFDLLPGGYVDDLGALVGALWTVTEHIKDEHVAKAQATVSEWFDDE